jgi:hypothetical protein
MGRTISSSIVAALAVGILVGGVAVYAIPVVANMRASSTTITEMSTVTTTRDLANHTHSNVDLHFHGDHHHHHNEHNLI